MSTTRRRRLPKTKHWREISADALKTVRETLGAEIQQKMSAYTNRALWKNPSQFSPNTPKETDPNDIKELKNCFLVLEFAENALRSKKNILRLTNELIGVYNSLSGITHLSRGLRSALEEVTRIINIIKSEKYSLEGIARQIQSGFSTLSTDITTKIYHLTGYRKSLPKNPAAAFELPPTKKSPQWFEKDFVKQERGKAERVNLEFDFFLNPVRKLMTGLETVFPELKFSEAPLAESGFIATPEWDSKENIDNLRQKKTLYQSTVALYNIMWAANRFVRSFSTKGKAHAMLDAPSFALKALDNLWLIDFSTNIPEEIQKRTRIAYKAYLEKLKDTFLKFEPDDIADIQQYEIDHHLKPGAITDELNALFSRIENFYLENHSYIKNPFTQRPNLSALEAQQKKQQTSREKSNLEKTRERYASIEKRLTAYANQAMPAAQHERDERIRSLIFDLEDLEKEIKTDPEKKNLEDTLKILREELAPTPKPEERPASLGWLGLMAASEFIREFTPDIIKRFVTTLYAPATAPAAIVGSNQIRIPGLNLNEYDIRLMFALPLTHGLKNTFILTQEPASLVYINETGEPLSILNEAGIKEKAAFLEKFIDRNTEKVSGTELESESPASIVEENEESESIKAELNREELISLNTLIQEKTGLSYALMPNPGLLGFLKTKQTECEEQLRDIDRKEEELEDAINAIAAAPNRTTLSLSTKRLLESRDLLRLISATRATEKNPELNLGIKSRLAALAADAKGEDRENTIFDAHARAVALLKNPDPLIALIKNLFDHQDSTPQDKLLCRELMTQLTLAPETAEKALKEKGILSFTSADTDQNNRSLKNSISQLLSQLDAGSLVTSIKHIEGEPSSPQARRNFAVFNLILNKKSVTTASIMSEIAAQRGEPGEEKAIGERQARTLNLLSQLHKTSDTDIQHNVGIFMANLALADKEFAQLIFSDPTYHNIVKKTCLESPEKNTTLYYEAWVNSLPAFNPQEASFQKIVEENKKIIAKMHEAVRPGHPPIQNYEEYYKKNQWELCQLQGDFITQCLSLNSEADKRIRSLFIATVSASGSLPLRRKLAEQFYKNNADATTPYYQFIKPYKKTFNAFWEEQKGLLLTSAQSYITQLGEMKKMLIACLNPQSEEYGDFKSTIAETFDKLQIKTRAIYNDFNNQSKKIPTYWVSARKELFKVMEEGNQQFASLQSVLQVQIAAPLNSSGQEANWDSALTVTSDSSDSAHSGDYSDDDDSSHNATPRTSRSSSSQGATPPPQSPLVSPITSSKDRGNTAKGPGFFNRFSVSGDASNRARPPLQRPSSNDQQPPQDAPPRGPGNKHS